VRLIISETIHPFKRFSSIQIKKATLLLIILCIMYDTIFGLWLRRNYWGLLHFMYIKISYVGVDVPLAFKIHLKMMYTTFNLALKDVFLPRNVFF